MSNFARRYEYWEVRDLLQSAEGAASPLTGKGAHSQTLHAMSPGRVGEADVMDRIVKRSNESNTSFKKRAAQTVGAFATRLQQGSAACEALNSAEGQKALAALDALGAGSYRLSMSLPISREAGFLPASGAPSFNKAVKGDAALTWSVKPCNIVMIVDCVKGAGTDRLHIQTCFPDDKPGASSSWTVQDWSSKATVASG